jgi:hypothetical protein
MTKIIGHENKIWRNEVSIHPKLKASKSEPASTTNSPKKTAVFFPKHPELLL